MINEHEYNDIQHAGFWEGISSIPSVINDGDSLIFWAPMLYNARKIFAVTYALDLWTYGSNVTIRGIPLFKVIAVHSDHVIMQSLKQD